VEVILLEKIRNLGGLGDKVKVKSGYGRNYLVPQGKADYATAVNVKKFEERRSELEKLAAEALKVAEGKKEALLAIKVVTIMAKAGEEGKLFGSVGTRDIADAITKAGVPVQKSDIRLPGGVLRQAGEYDIEVECHSDVVALLKLNVLPEV